MRLIIILACWLLIFREFLPVCSISITSQLLLYRRRFPQLNLTRPIREVVALNCTFPREVINQCYEQWLNGVQVDIFEPNVSTFQVVSNYYRSQQDKKITAASIEHLIESARAIARYVLACIRSPRPYRLGFTSMSDKSSAEFMGLMSYKGKDVSSMSFGGSSLERIAQSCYPPRSFRAPERLDWTALGAVSPVRHQGYCASCWVFASIAALESAYLRTHRTLLDLSEQQLVDCAKAEGDGCGSGTSFRAWQHIYSYGVTSEASYPYRATNHSCPAKLPPASARIRHFCVRGRNWYGHNSASSLEALSDEEIARTVAFFGPISVCLNGERLLHYKSGVFDDPNCSTNITHMALLVGYTPQSWILKNSWGVHWGQKGFFQVARRKNMCGIQFEVAYPLI